MNKGPQPGPPGGEKQIDKPAPLYNKVEIPNTHVVESVSEYGAGADLKDKLIQSQEKLITHLEKECNNLKARLEATEKRLHGPPEDEDIKKKAI